MVARPTPPLSTVCDNDRECHASVEASTRVIEQLECDFGSPETKHLEYAVFSNFVRIPGHRAFEESRDAGHGAVH